MCPLTTFHHHAVLAYCHVDGPRLAQEANIIEGTMKYCFRHYAAVTPDNKEPHLLPANSKIRELFCHHVYVPVKPVIVTCLMGREATENLREKRCDLRSETLT